MKHLLQTWEALSKKVLSSVLVDEGAVFPVGDIIQGNTRWFPPKDRPVWRGINKCLDDFTPPTVEAVTLRMNGSVNPEYVKVLAGHFTEDDNEKLVYNTEQLKEIGTIVAIRELSKDLEGLTTPEQIPDTINKIETELSGIMANRSDRNPNAYKVSEGAWEGVENFDMQAIPTGIKWFDTLTGGLWTGMNYWIAAAYKSGKSTLMRNAVLASARNNFPVIAFCAEGSREMFALDCQMMLATEILLDQGCPRNKLRLSSLFIKKSWKKRDLILRKDELDAIQEARLIWDNLPIFTYDTRDRIRDLTTLSYIIKRDRIERGVRSAWLDYSQLFGKGKTLFERQSSTALGIQEIATEQDVALCILAQKNEDGVKYGGDSHSPNIKGGGDGAAAADFLFEPKIDQDVPDHLQLKLKFSRHAMPAQGNHLFNPSSGLILDKWFEAKTINLAA